VSDPQPPDRPPPEGEPEAPRPPETPEAAQPPETPPPSEGGAETPEPETPETAEQPPEGTSPAAAPPAYEPPQPHPVQLVVFDDLKRSRLTVFFRLLLLIPHTLWQSLWGILISVLLIINWFAVLLRGRSPEDLHLLLARALRYWTHVTSYTYLVSNPYPTFFGRLGTHPVDLEVEGPERQRRVITFFRLILAIPVFVVAYVFIYVMLVVAFIGWFIALVVGRMPKGMRDLSAYCLQYEAQTWAYLMILTDRYPSFSGPRS